jgi:outer membrane protein TolC
MKIIFNTQALGISLLLSFSTIAEAVPINSNWSSSLLERLEQSSQWQQLNTNLDASKAEEAASMQPLYNPEIEMSYEDSSERAYQITVSQKVDLFDKQENHSQMASIEKQITERVQKQKQTELLNTALVSLFQSQRYENLLDLAEQQLVVSQRLVKLTQQKVQAGDITQVDLELVKIALLDAIQVKVEVQKSLALNKSQQQILLGTAPLTVPEQLASDLPSTPDFINLSRKTPKVMIANLEAQLAQLRIRQSVDESKAEPTLGLGMGRDGNDNVVALSVSFPLNIRNNYRANISAAEARAQTSDHIVTQTMLEVEKSLRRNWSVVTQQNDLQTLWKNPSKLSVEHLSQQLEKLWEIGELTTTDYLRNLQQLSTSLATEINLQAEANLSLIEWLSSSNQLVTWLDQQ